MTYSPYTERYDEFTIEKTIKLKEPAKYKKMKIKLTPEQAAEFIEDKFGNIDSISISGMEYGVSDICRDIVGEDSNYIIVSDENFYKRLNKNYYFKSFVLDIETKTEYEAYWYTTKNSITSSGGTGSKLNTISTILIVIM